MLRVIRWLAQIGCTHNDIRRFDGGHMWVECLKCGRESGGIRTKSKAPVHARATARSASRVDFRSAA
jgi:hypothetical protein